MLRFDIINYLISTNGYKSFLEIGTQAKINFTSVSVDRKVCVDPDPNASADYQMTSDDYFRDNFEKFDIVFVDGLHHADAAYRDIINSLKRLNIGGCIVVHDVIPFSYEAQVIPLQKASDMGTVAWNGDVWKAWVKLRTERKDLDMRCVNTDHGCGIISFSDSPCNMDINDFNDGYYRYDRENIMGSLNLISEDDFINVYRSPLKFSSSTSGVRKCYVTHTDRNYIPVAENLVKSLSLFSGKKVIVYCINCTEDEILPLLKYKNCLVRILEIPDLVDSQNLQYEESGNFYVERSNKRTYQILSAKVNAMESALEEGWDEICYLDSDCLATPLVDEIFNWSGTITNYPLGTEGIHNYMLIIKDGKQIGNPFENSWPNPDNTLCLEWPLMDFFGISPERRGKYRTTGIMLMNYKCLGFIKKWKSVCEMVGRSFNDLYNIAPFHEETIYNVLLWMVGDNGLPLCYVNLSDGSNTVRNFYSDSVKAGDRSWDDTVHENRFFAIPEDKNHVKVFHGEKRKKEADIIMDFLLNKHFHYEK